MAKNLTVQNGGPLLAGLGERVRALRANRGITRKRLAQASGISERFLAQLESGTGNISILRLADVARALRTRPADLLKDIECDTCTVASARRTALIGLRGAGKSTLGRAVAERLKVPFVELTDRIERQSGLRVAEIFNLYGNTGYRQLEREALKDVIADNGVCILATAGGITEDHETFSLLLENFHTVWLTATPDEHMQRVRSQGDKRPMRGQTQAMNALKAILGNRSRDYARADAILDTSGQSALACAERLASLLHAGDR